MRAARCLRHLVLLCGLLPALLLQPVSAKEHIFWLVRDLPPFTFLKIVAESKPGKEPNYGDYINLVAG